MLVTIETEAKVVEVALCHVGHIGLQCTDRVSWLIFGSRDRKLTRLKMPWGWPLSSARLA